MEHIIRTAIGASLQTSLLLSLPVQQLANTTLNEKFNILATTTLASTDKPSLKYVSIGNGGHRAETGTDGFAKIKAVQHKPRDTALYNHLPFILRLPNDDLLPTERIKYRLRRSEVHGGQNYIAYYLKVLDMTATNPQLELRTVVDGVTTVSTYVPTAADLAPTPPLLNSGGVLTTTGDYVAATAKVPFTMSQADIDEFLNVCNIIYGDTNYAIISELALCSGLDKDVPGDFNGATATYKDAIGVQVINFVNTFFAVKYVNNEINVMFDIGNSEPMLTLA